MSPSPTNDILCPLENNEGTSSSLATAIVTNDQGLIIGSANNRNHDDDEPIENKVTNGNSMNIVGRSRDVVHGDNLFMSIRPLLILGKLIGLWPLTGMFQEDPGKLHFRKLGPSSLVSLSICGLLGGNMVMGLLDMFRRPARHAADYATAPAIFIFYIAGFYAYVYFYKKSVQFVQLLIKWGQMSIHFTIPDKHLHRDCGLMMCGVMGSIILQNILGHFRFIPGLQQSHVFKSPREKLNSTTLEIFYYRSQSIWADASVPYTPYILAYGFLSNKFANWAWNYVDVLIAVLARAIYFKFKVLYWQGQKILEAGKIKFDAEQWRQLTADHETLCDMLDEIEAFLCPLVFLTYSVNTYYLCLKLHAGISPSKNSNLLVSAFAVWVFLHLMVRILLVSITGARIHEWAHKISRILRKCPRQVYINEVIRREQFAGTNVIALSGLGCFTVTRQLLLQIVGVVLTSEIVLLQASQTQFESSTGGGGGGGKTNPCTCHPSSDPPLYLTLPIQN